MLFTFKSEAGADVLMFGDVAKKLLGVIGKDGNDAKGIVTVEQLPGAISRLRAAIDEDKARQAERSAQQDDEDAERAKSGLAGPVGLAQRAWPLLDLLERAHKEGVPVVWGV